MDINIIYQDSDILVINKPAGIPVETKSVTQKDCESEIKKILASGGGKNPYLAVINRLDQPVNGLVLFALNKESAAKLSDDLTGGRIEKYYKASVFGEFETKEGVLEDMLFKDAKTNRSFVVKEKDPEFAKTKKAILEDREECPGSRKIKLVTGRHHQIRVQLANAGHPILGDLKYGTKESKEESSKREIDGLQLTACRLKFTHPKTGKQMDFTV